MKITIRFSQDEAQNIITNYALTEFPVNTEGKEVYVREEYGTFTVSIEDATEENIDA